MRIYSYITLWLLFIFITIWKNGNLINVLIKKHYISISYILENILIILFWHDVSFLILCILFYTLKTLFGEGVQDCWGGSQHKKVQNHMWGTGDTMYQLSGGFLLCGGDIQNYAHGTLGGTQHGRTSLPKAGKDFVEVISNLRFRRA